MESDLTGGRIPHKIRTRDTESTNVEFKGGGLSSGVWIGYRGSVAQHCNDTLPSFIIFNPPQ